MPEEIKYGSPDRTFGVVKSHKKFLGAAITAMSKMMGIFYSINEKDPNKMEFPKRMESELASIDVSSDLNSIKSAWDKISEISKEIESQCGNIKEVEDFKRSVKEIAGKYSRGEVRRPDYAKEVQKKSEEIYKKIGKDDLEVILSGEYKKAASYLNAAVEKYKDGALIVLKEIKKEDTSTLEKISDDIEEFLVGSTVSKAKSTGTIASEKKKKSERTVESYTSKFGDKKITESFSDFLKKTRKAAREIADQTAFSNKELKSPDKATLDITARNLYSNLIAVDSEIDNIISGISKNDDRDEYEGSASNIKDIIKSSLEKIEKIREKIPNASKRDLEEYEVELGEITVDAQRIMDPRAGKGGSLFNKWKEEASGEGNLLVGEEFYDKGNELVEYADKILSEVIDRKYLKLRLKDSDGMEILKKSIKALTGGESSELPSRISKDSYLTFSDKPEKKDSKAIKKYQEDLKKTGIADKSEMKEGEYDEATKKSTEKAISYLSKITGKEYAKEGDSFRDFQRDFRVYSDNLGTIRKRLDLN